MWNEGPGSPPPLPLPGEPDRLTEHPPLCQVELRTCSSDSPAGCVWRPDLARDGRGQPSDTEQALAPATRGHPSNTARPSSRPCCEVLWSPQHTHPQAAGLVRETPLSMCPACRTLPFPTDSLTPQGRGRRGLCRRWGADTGRKGQARAQAGMQICGCRAAPRALSVPNGYSEANAIW